jgi:hypothetical protein
MYKLIALLFCMSSAVLAQTTNADVCLTLTDKIEQPLDVEDRFQTAIAKHFNVRFDSEKLALDNLDDPFGGPSAFPVVIRVYYDHKKLAQCQANKWNGTLSFDINVPQEARGLGVYAYSLKKILDRHSDVVSIPSRMKYANSDNAKFLFDTVFGARNNWKIAQPTEKATLVDDGFRSNPRHLRQEIISAFEKMPSTKARRRLGFANVRKIIIDPLEISVSFDVTKGEQTRSTELYLVERSGQAIVVSEITEGGDRIVRGEDVLQLHDYDKLAGIADYYKIKR